MNDLRREQAKDSMIGGVLMFAFGLGFLLFLGLIWYGNELEGRPTSGLFMAGVLVCILVALGGLGLAASSWFTMRRQERR
jgi:hypothetical protein